MHYSTLGRLMIMSWPPVVGLSGALPRSPHANADAPPIGDCGSPLCGGKLSTQPLAET